MHMGRPPSFALPAGQCLSVLGRPPPRHMAGAVQEPLAVADLDLVGANEVAAKPFDHRQQCQKVARSSDIVAVEKAER